MQTFLRRKENRQQVWAVPFMLSSLIYESTGLVLECIVGYKVAQEFLPRLCASYNSSLSSL
jgi:hypothetical protein